MDWKDPPRVAVWRAVVGAWAPWAQTGDICLENEYSEPLRALPLGKNMGFAVRDSKKATFVVKMSVLGSAGAPAREK